MKTKDERANLFFEELKSLQKKYGFDGVVAGISVEETIGTMYVDIATSELAVIISDFQKFHDKSLAEEEQQQLVEEH